MIKSFNQLFSNENQLDDWTMFLINHPDPEQRHPTHLHHLQQAARFLTASEYTQEILKERNLNDLCGYPVCINQPIKHSNTNLKVKDTYSLSPPEPPPMFCSQECRDRSDDYLNLVLKKSSSHSVPRSKYNNNNNNNNKKRIHHRHIPNRGIIDRDHSLLLEELDQDHHPLEHTASPSESEQNKPSHHDFLQPFLTQSLQRDKRADHNLNPIFSSIQIIEHPPQKLSASSDPPRSSHHLNELEHQFLNHFNPSNLSSPPAATIQTTRTLTTKTNRQSHSHLLHELSSSWIQTLSSRVVLSNSNPGTYVQRQLTHASTHPTRPPSSNSPLSNPSSSIQPGLSDSTGSSEAEIIYNVGSLQDQLAIDYAMTLRDSLDLNALDP